MRTMTVIVFALSSALVVPATAQYAARPTVQTTPADQLASLLRRLATAPTDLYALISAGELSVKLDDMSAAAAFFARADRIDPRNGRVKAGMASILVRAERPGEALRYYQMAETFGLPVGRFAADRGLAHDLLGEQVRAQRDYRLALRTAPDDETVRRYALSLGISGDKVSALEQLDPMLRRQDRAAWRVRAFVLAMNGDAPGANKIATAMMPAGMAAGMRPFLAQLSTLTAADRAFAVHFGEVRPTPARLADARMKPVLPALGPDPQPPVRLAAVQRPAPPPAVAQDRGRIREERRRDRRDRTQLAAVTRTAPRTPAARAAPVTPSAAPPPARSAVRRAPTPIIAASRPTPPAPRPAVSPTTALATPPAARTAAPVRVAGLAATVPPRAVEPAPAPVRAEPAPERQAPVANVPITATPSFSAGATAATARDVNPTIDQPRAAFTDVGDDAATVAAAAPVSAMRSEDSILARIVGSITIPGEELGVTAPVRKPVEVVRVDPATARTLALGKAKAAIETADRADAARLLATAAKIKPIAAKSGARAGRGAKVELASRAGAAGDGKAVKPGASAERRDARSRSADAKTPAEKKNGSARSGREPERIWVQVAGGANQGDLPKAWSAAQKKAAALKGRQAYSTPQRATNRVVTGPFKTEAEARAFVNQLARQGVSAFQFTSAAGQKMTRLPGK